MNLDPAGADARRHRARRRWWRTAAWCTALTVAGTATVLAAQGFIGRPGEPDARRPAGPADTVPVARETLVEEVTVAGRLDYGPPVPLSVPGPGTVTWLPPVGAPVRRGQSLLRIDELPVVLLYGSIPMYRPLAVDAEGSDVAQFERNLRALGYEGFDVDESYTEGTAAAVKRWQRWMGRRATGVVRPGDVVYVRGSIRIAEQRGRLGAPNGADVLAYTRPEKLVTVDAKADRLDWAKKGRKVKVVLPNGKTVGATIAAVSAEATSVSDDGKPETPVAGVTAPDATVPVTITIADQEAVRDYVRSPVDVRTVLRERRNVLTVPVIALLALAEGGYGVEVVEGTVSRVVAVKVGMFTDARVEVRSPELREGERVGITS